jgi:hypothetical protein
MPLIRAVFIASRSPLAISTPAPRLEDRRVQEFAKLLQPKA